MASGVPLNIYTVYTGSQNPCQDSAGQDWTRGEKIIIRENKAVTSKQQVRRPANTRFVVKVQPPLPPQTGFIIIGGPTWAAMGWNGRCAWGRCHHQCSAILCSNKPTEQKEGRQSPVQWCTCLRHIIQQLIGDCPPRPLARPHGSLHIYS